MNRTSLARRPFERVLLASMLLLTACATVSPEMEPLKISIANIDPKDFAIFEQRFDVQLRIQNPNEKDLGTKGDAIRH